MCVHYSDIKHPYHLWPYQRFTHYWLFVMWIHRSPVLRNFNISFAVILHTLLNKQSYFTLCGKWWQQWRSFDVTVMANILPICTVQSSAVITRSKIIRYCINNCRNWGRISIRCQIHKRHPIPRPNGRAFVFCEYLWENWPRYNGIAQYMVYSFTFQGRPFMSMIPAWLNWVGLSPI